MSQTHQGSTSNFWRNCTVSWSQTSVISQLCIPLIYSRKSTSSHFRFQNCNPYFLCFLARDRHHHRYKENLPDFVNSSTNKSVNNYIAQLRIGGDSKSIRRAQFNDVRFLWRIEFSIKVASTYKQIEYSGTLSTEYNHCVNWARVFIRNIQARTFRKNWIVLCWIIHNCVKHVAGFFQNDTIEMFHNIVDYYGRIIQPFQKSNMFSVEGSG